MPTIYCPECDHPIELPAELMAAGVAKLRCPVCGAVLRILPGGVVLTLSVGGTGSTGVGGSGGSSGGSSSPSPSTGGGYGGGLNLSVAGPPPTGASGGSPVPQSGGGAGFSYPELELGTVFRDKWRIDGELGRGGTAVVYRAWDIDADLPVALKVVGVVDGDADALRRSWADEYKSRRKVADGRYLLGVESPAIEEREGVTYVVLPQELGEKTLRQWLRETKDDVEGREEEGLRLFSEICRGVEALHEAGIAHLDLKPENVLLVESGGGRDKGFIAKVGDFGLARAGGSLGRREGAGTPAYMSPEQVRSAREKEIGPWSDIYSLGCILFEILDGDPPFSGSDEELKRKHLEMEPPELLGVAKHLEDLILSCLAKKRGDRPSSVSVVRVGTETNPAEEAAYGNAQQANSESGWKSYLKAWGNGRHAKAAETALAGLIAKREAAEAAERERKAREAAERRERERQERERERKEAAEAERKRQEEALRQAQAEEERRRKEALRAQPGRDWVVPELGLELMWIEAGTFQFSGEYGAKKVRCTLSQGFWLGKYAVTQGEYKRITGEKPSRFNGSDRLPVESVDWDDAMAYCEALNRKYVEQLPSGYRFSLPTEAQWEYACRAGTNTDYSFGDAENQLGHYGWYDGNSGDKTHPVGEKRPNPWGLYDMHGNVLEWCLDWYEDLPAGSVTDWLGPATGSDRVHRGGYFAARAEDCRSGRRGGSFPDFGIHTMGFRLALSSNR